MEMKISELIKTLQEHMTEYGDIGVTHWDQGYGEEEIMGLTVKTDPYHILPDKSEERCMTAEDGRLYYRDDDMIASQYVDRDQVVIRNRLFMMCAEA